ncbi:MAG: carboxy terminal-processing peptidase [Cytophagales bacterium]|nr:carboxy terminal-processing peptidase [Bernardetiaceae bacterium]MDW8204240.1 carboxy terminal-processing peptidase [Cytophagales bacterium]
MKNSLKIAVLCAGLLLLMSYSPTRANLAEDSEREQVLLRLVMQSLQARHYAAVKIDDSFSKKMYKIFIDQLDFNKRFFTQQDLQLLAAYELQLDDEINNNRYHFYNLAHQLLNKRIEQAERFCDEILAQPFDFTVQETYQTDPEKTKPAKDEAELKQQWRKYLKYYTMVRLSNTLDVKEQAQKNPNDTAAIRNKTLAELEQEARENTAKDFKEYFKRLKETEKPEQISTYINAITATFDPHTNYYAPRAKERFDEDFSGRFEGIGAQLQQERGGLIKVVEIIPGSASWRQGELRAGDYILAVAQGNSEPVDVTTMRLDNAVRLIKGKKGTEVRLTVRKPDGTIKVIPIIRDVVIREEAYIKSVIVRNKNNKKIGYIYLPGFYADFSNSGGRNCGEDMRKELQKLKAEGVEGIVLDLRNNGGGSLQDVVEMTGLFIEKGPVVQVKAKSGAPIVLEDTDPSVVYSGPLVVMVNSFSASASEILSGAIQDYKRGIIVGSNSTFGKGTVQTIMDLDRMLPPTFNNIKPLGSLMLTIQKFYRINGTTNQLKGVVPDIVLPDNYSYLKVGEKQELYPLPPDEIAPLNYKVYAENEARFAKAKQNSHARVAQNPQFALIEQTASRLKRMREETEVTLHLEKYRAQQAKDREEAKKTDARLQFTSELEFFNAKADLPEINLDSTRIRKNKEWINNLKKDLYLNEALLVLRDIM